MPWPAFRGGPEPERTKIESWCSDCICLVLAMGLTTIWVAHRNAPRCKTPYFKESCTSEDVRGYAANVWGSKSHESLSFPLPP